MNMISTGAFLNEMDASSKQLSTAEKFAAVWEKKNAKAARAGGVSLMALSLAACGGSSSTTTTTDTSTGTTTTTPATDAAKTLTFTTKIDILEGGSGDDTFIGDSTSGVVTVGDQVTGGAGSDTLKLYGTATLPELSGIESIFIKGAGATTEVINTDFSGLTGVTSVEYDTADTDADGATSFTIAAGQVVTLDSITDGDATNDGNNQGEFEINSAATVTSASLVLQGVGAAGAGDLDLEVLGTKIATIDITTSGAAGKSTVDASTISLAVNGTSALTKLTLAGDKNLTITNNIDFKGTTSGTVDASGMSGDLSIQLANGEAVTVTGGSGKNTIVAGAGDDNITGGAAADTVTIGGGNDTVDTGAGDDTLIATASQLTAGDTITLGAGEDTLSTSDATISNATSGMNAAFKNVKDAEIVATSAVGDKVINLTAIDTFSVAKVTAHTTQAVAGSNASGGTAGEDGIDFTADTTNNTLIIAADIQGETGQESASSNTAEAGGTGGIGIDINASVDLGNNVVNLEFIDDADVTGGTGGLKSAVSGSGGTAGIAIDANEFEVVNIQLSATDTTADTVTFAGGLGGAKSGGSAADSDVGIQVAAGGKIVVTEEISGTATATTVSAIDFNTIAGTNVVVDASAITGAVTINAVSGNTVITTGGGKDTILAGTGADTITLGAGDDIVDSQTGKDTLTLGTGNDVVRINAVTTDGSMASDSNSTNFTTITDFKLLDMSVTTLDLSTETKFMAASIGEADLINFGGGTTSVAADAAEASATVNSQTVKYTINDGEVVITSNAAAITTDAHAIALLDAAVGGNVTDGITAAVEVLGNVYVLSNNSDANEDQDMVVKLTGVTGLTGLELADASATDGAGTLFIM